MPWSRADTRAAREQFEVLLSSDEFESVLIQELEQHGVFSHGAQANIAATISFMVRVYNDGEITTKTFLAVVKDLVGGT